MLRCPRCDRFYALRAACALLLALGACETWRQAKGFFQARPVDESTALRVETSPPLGDARKGSVEIDGKQVATATPYTHKPIAPGHHKVRIEADAHIGQELELELEEGETKTLSLLLKPLPAPPPLQAEATPKPEGAARKTKRKAGKDKPDVGAAEEEEPVRVRRALLLTSTPPREVFLDSLSFGAASGLKVPFFAASAELKVGDEGRGLTLVLTNKKNGLRVKAKNLGQRSLMVDGVPLATKASFDLDSRPRRVEVMDVGGRRLVVLMKLVEP